jgi:hypothetical protein
MEWLNYHHLLYFWMVVRTGSVTAASNELRYYAIPVERKLKHPAVVAICAAARGTLFARHGPGTSRRARRPRTAKTKR